VRSTVRQPGENGLRHPIIIWGLAPGGFKHVPRRLRPVGSMASSSPAGLSGNGQGSPGDARLPGLRVHHVCAQCGIHPCGGIGSIAGGGGRDHDGERTHGGSNTAPVMPYILRGSAASIWHRSESRRVRCFCSRDGRHHRRPRSKSAARFRHHQRSRSSGQNLSAANHVTTGHRRHRELQGQ